MTDILVVRQTADDAWQWRYADSRTGWRDDSVRSGDLEALGEDLPRQGMPAFYILPGERVVAQQINVETRERRHLAKLVPFQLEEQAVDPVDELHFTLGPLRDKKVAAAYTRLDDLQSLIAQLESVGCDVVHCVADFLMIERPEDGWTFLVDQERLLIHSGEGLGLAVELELAQAVLPALVQGRPRPAVLRLCADTDTALADLRARLPRELTEAEALTLESQRTDFWNLIDPTVLPELDFRSGALGRRLPLARWWREWRTPAIATAAAFVLAIGVTGAQYWRAQAQQEALLEDMVEVYRQAVPNAGTDVRDPERLLRSLVSGLGGSQASSNLMHLLSQVAPAIDAREGLTISSFRYSQDNRELQLNLEAEDFSLLESLRSDISERGLQAELLRVSAQGDVHQARMRVVEGTL